MSSLEPVKNKHFAVQPNSAKKKKGPALPKKEAKVSEIAQKQLQPQSFDMRISIGSVSHKAFKSVKLFFPISLSEINDFSGDYYIPLDLIQVFDEKVAKRLSSSGQRECIEITELEKKEKDEHGRKGKPFWTVRFYSDKKRELFFGNDGTNYYNEFGCVTGNYFGEYLYQVIEIMKATWGSNIKQKQISSSGSTVLKSTPLNEQVAIITRNIAPIFSNLFNEAIRSHSLKNPNIFRDNYIKTRKQLQHSIRELIPSNSKISFNEPINLIFESISQLAVLDQKCSTEDKRKILEKIAIQWIKMDEQFDLVLEDVKLIPPNEDLEHVSNCFRAVKGRYSEISKLIQSLSGSLSEHDLSIASEIERIHKPILEYFNVAMKAKNYLEDAAFYEIFMETFGSKIASIHSIEIHFDTQGTLLGKRLKRRADLLGLGIDLKGIDTLDKLLQDLKSSAKDRDWANVLRSTFAINVEIYQIKKLVQNGQEVRIKLSELCRLDKKTNALQIEIRDLFKQGHLYQPVSKIALKELKHAQEGLQKPLSPYQATEFLKEALESKEQEMGELIDTLQSSWKKLKEIRQEFIQSKVYRKQIPDLLKMTQEGDFSKVPLLWLEMNPLISEVRKEWETHLQLFSESIDLTQDLMFLLMSKGEFPNWTPKDFRSQFKEFNARIKELTIPMMELLNALNKLIRIDNVFKEKYKEETDRLLLLPSKGAPVSISLFQTNEEVFKNMEDQLQGLREKDLMERLKTNSLIKEELILEDLPPLIDIKPAENSPQMDIEAEVSLIFAQTKRAKIEKELNKLLHKRGISYSKVTGKRHFKFFVNGSEVTLPSHKEWKRGTKNSIQEGIMKGINKGSKS